MNDHPVNSAEPAPINRQKSSSGIHLLILLVIAVAVRLAWILILPNNAVSLDILAWKWIAIELLDRRNPYADGNWLNYPPFVMEMIYGLARLSQWYGFNFVLNFKLIVLAGDMGLLTATYLLLKTLRPSSDTTILLLMGYCLNPLMILLTSQHTNIDSLCMVWVVLSLYFVIQFRRTLQPSDWICAAGCLGLAAFVKQFPFVLWPVLVPGFRRVEWRLRVVGLVLLIGPVFFSLSPLYVLNPVAITHNVLEYRSLGNTFGLVGLSTLVGFDRFLPVYSGIFTVTLFVSSIITAITLWRSDWESDADPVLYSAIILLSLFTIGPGYGSQYWMWVVPLILICYPNFGCGFRRITALALMVIIITNVFEYGIETNLGAFFLRLCPSEATSRLSNFFPYPSKHLIWLRLPMSFTAIFWLVSSVKLMIRRIAGGSTPSQC